MRRFSFKKFFTVCLALFALGAIIVLISFITLGFELTGLSGTKAVEGEYTVLGEAVDIKINLLTSDLNLSFGGDEIIVRYAEEFTNSDKQITDFEISENGTLLEISEKKISGNWAILFNFAQTKLDITLPERYAYNLSVAADTADINITGERTSFNSLTVVTDTGDMSAQSLTVTEKISITTDTGDVTLGNTTAKRLEIETDTGDVRLCDLTLSETAVFLSDTGEVRGYGTITASALSFEMGSGDIELANAKIDAGHVRVEGDTSDTQMTLVGKRESYSLTYSTDTGDTNLRPYISGERGIEVTTDTGDLEIYFTE